MPPLIMTIEEAEELMALVEKSIGEAEALDLASSEYFSTQTEARIRNVNRRLD